MIRTAIVAAVTAALAAATPAAAKQYVDYTFEKGVWEINQVDVDPNHIDDYLTGLRRTQVPYFEAMKKRGLVDTYKLVVRNGYTKNAPSVLIMVHFTSLTALAPDKARDEAIDKELLATLSEEDGKAAVVGYEKYRAFLDDAFFTEVTMAK